MDAAPSLDRTDTMALPAGTRFVDAFVIDVNGIPRGKRLTAAAWEAASGVGFSASALVLDQRGVAQGPLGIGTQDGDPDGLGIAVPGMLQPVPWAQGEVAQCLLSMVGRDGAPLWYDPREVLREVVEKCRADGLHPVVSVELEFYLVGQDEAGRPAPLRKHGGAGISTGHLCLQNLEDHAGFLNALHDALSAQNIPADGIVSEYGPGQLELNLLHGPDPLLAADQAVLQRRATLGVASAMGLKASFMAKPFAAHSGNGLHVHVSLVDEAGRNRFGAAGGEALLHHAVAGLQAVHAESMAIFAPSFSAYRRYRAGSFVALSSAWGEDNRSVAFRVPRGGASARRIEHRVAAADASPHLVMAAILAGLHHGITQRLTPSAPAEGNADAAEDASLPRDIYDALRRFEHGAILASYVQPRFTELFATLKRAEADDLMANVMPVEFDFYL